MKQGFSAGCGIEVSLKIANTEKCFEFVKPNYFASVREEWDTEEDGLTLSEEELVAKVAHYHEVLRRLVESEIDVDIYDIKKVKLFQEVLAAKGGK